MLDRRTLQISGLAILACALGACAKHPDAIAATYVSHASYRGLDCDALSQEQQRLGAILARASNQQENARMNDALGIILIGVPVSSLSGDNIAAEIARLKGENEALNRRMLEADCLGAWPDDRTGPSERRATNPRQTAPRHSAVRSERGMTTIPLPAAVESRRAERETVNVHRVMMHGVLD
jgi:hypothetical protein